jgi:ferredoxin
MKAFAASLIAAVLLLSLADHGFTQEATRPTTDMTIRQIAHDTGLKGRDLAERLGLPGQVNKDTPLFELGINQQQLKSALVDLPPVTDSADVQGISANTDMTLQEAAHALGMTGKELAYTLGLSVEVDKQIPLSELGVTDEKLYEAVEHAAHEAGGIGWIKYPIWVLISITALVLLLRKRAKKSYYLYTLSVSLLATGFLLGKAPNPMESVSKIFKTAAGVYPDVAVKILSFLFFCILAVVGNKIICGWGCPFGALQELLYELPLGRAIGRLRKKQIPFVLANSLRIAFFTAFVLVVFGVVGNRKGLVLYHYVNVFNLFDFEFEVLPIFISITLFTVISFFAYRTFCQFVCPFGLISWLLERVSLAGVRVDRKACTDCRACAAACPLEAMKGRLDGQSFPADCFSCARCLRSCNYDALHYETAWDNRRSRQSGVRSF